MDPPLPGSIPLGTLSTAGGRCVPAALLRVYRVLAVSGHGTSRSSSWSLSPWDSDPSPPRLGWRTGRTAVLSSGSESLSPSPGLGSVSGPACLPGWIFPQIPGGSSIPHGEQVPVGATPLVPEVCSEHSRCPLVAEARTCPPRTHMPGAKGLAGRGTHSRCSINTDILYGLYTHAHRE